MDAYKKIRSEYLGERWKENEKKLEEAYSLKAGPESPIDRIEELEADQDAIEYEAGLEYLAERRKEREEDQKPQNQ